MLYDQSPPPTYTRRTSRRRWAYVYAAILAILFLFVIVPLPKDIETPRNSLFQQITKAAKGTLPGSLRTRPIALPPGLESVQSKYAFATFLSHDENKEVEEVENDNYLTAVRILAYQLLHAPETRTQKNIPFIVMVNKDVSETYRDRLRRDGAIVWQPEPVDPGWIQTDVNNWASVLMKLRLWELTQFERVCFLDGDTVLTRSLDGVFEEPESQLQTTGTNPSAIEADEAPLPAHYVFAGVVEMSPVHHFPPTEEGHDWPNSNYLNAGFLVLQPNLDLLSYYFSLFQTPDRFNPTFPEQNLWNYAHRREGNMAWQQLNTSWNMHYPTVEDKEGGVASLHDHWWKPVDLGLRPYFESVRWRMRGFHESRDASMDRTGHL